MNTLLSVGTWFAQNWMLLVLIVLAIALLVPTYLRQRKEANNRAELNRTITKGTKIVTTAGVYGVVESLEETTDGTVVTINTGSSKNPTTMTIHINAIMGIDNKMPADSKGQPLASDEKTDDSKKPESKDGEDSVESKVADKPKKSKSAKKSKF